MDNDTPTFEDIAPEPIAVPLAVLEGPPRVSFTLPVPFEDVVFPQHATPAQVACDLAFRPLEDAIRLAWRWVSNDGIPPERLGFQSTPYPCRRHGAPLNVGLPLTDRGPSAFLTFTLIMRRNVYDMLDEALCSERPIVGEAQRKVLLTFENATVEDVLLFCEPYHRVLHGGKTSLSNQAIEARTDRAQLLSQIEHWRSMDDYVIQRMLDVEQEQQQTARNGNHVEPIDTPYWKAMSRDLFCSTLPLPSFQMWWYARWCRNAMPLYDKDFAVRSDSLRYATLSVPCSPMAYLRECLERDVHETSKYPETVRPLHDAYTNQEATLLRETVLVDFLDTVQFLARTPAKEVELPETRHWLPSSEHLESEWEAQVGQADPRATLFAELAIWTDKTRQHLAKRPTGRQADKANTLTTDLDARIRRAQHCLSYTGASQSGWSDASTVLEERRWRPQRLGKHASTNYLVLAALFYRVNHALEHMNRARDIADAYDELEFRAQHGDGTLDADDATATSAIGARVFARNNGAAAASSVNGDTGNYATSSATINQLYGDGQDDAAPAFEDMERNGKDPVVIMLAQYHWRMGRLLDRMKRHYASQPPANPRRDAALDRMHAWKRFAYSHLALARALLDGSRCDDAYALEENLAEGRLSRLTACYPYSETSLGEETLQTITDRFRLDDAIYATPTCGAVVNATANTAAAVTSAAGPDDTDGKIEGEDILECGFVEEGIFGGGRLSSTDTRAPDPPKAATTLAKRRGRPPNSKKAQQAQQQQQQQVTIEAPQPLPLDTTLEPTEDQLLIKELEAHLNGLDAEEIQDVRRVFMSGTVPTVNGEEQQQQQQHHQHPIDVAFEDLMHNSDGAIPDSMLFDIGGAGVAGATPASLDILGADDVPQFDSLLRTLDDGERIAGLAEAERKRRTSRRATTAGHHNVAVVPVGTVLMQQSSASGNATAQAAVSATGVTSRPRLNLYSNPWVVIIRKLWPRPCADRDFPSKCDQVSLAHPDVYDFVVESFTASLLGLYRYCRNPAPFDLAIKMTRAADLAQRYDACRHVFLAVLFSMNEFVITALRENLVWQVRGDMSVWMLNGEWIRGATHVARAVFHHHRHTGMVETVTAKGFGAQSLFAGTRFLPSILAIATGEPVAMGEPAAGANRSQMHQENARVVVSAQQQQETPSIMLAPAIPHRPSIFRVTNPGFVEYMAHMFQAIQCEAPLVAAANRLVEYTDALRGKTSSATVMHGPSIFRLSDAAFKLVLYEVQRLRPDAHIPCSSLDRIGVSSFGSAIVATAHKLFTSRAHDHTVRAVLCGMQPLDFELCAIFFRYLYLHSLRSIVPLDPTTTERQARALRRHWQMPPDSDIPEHVCCFMICNIAACREVRNILVQQTHACREFGAFWAAEDASIGACVCLSKKTIGVAYRNMVAPPDMRVPWYAPLKPIEGETYEQRRVRLAQVFYGRFELLETPPGDERERARALSYPSRAIKIAEAVAAFGMALTRATNGQTLPEPLDLISDDALEDKLARHPHIDAPTRAMVQNAQRLVRDLCTAEARRLEESKYVQQCYRSPVLMAPALGYAIGIEGKKLAPFTPCTICPQCGALTVYSINAPLASGPNGTLSYRFSVVAFFVDHVRRNIFFFTPADELLCATFVLHDVACLANTRRYCLEHIRRRLFDRSILFNCLSVAASPQLFARALFSDAHQF